MGEYNDLHGAAERVRKRLERVKQVQTSIMEVQKTLGEIIDDAVNEQKAIELQIQALSGYDRDEDNKKNRRDRK